MFDPITIIEFGVAAIIGSHFVQEEEVEEFPDVADDDGE